MEKTNKPIHGVQRKSADNDKLSIRIQPALKKDLLDYCDKRNMNVAEFVRTAIADAMYGKKEEKNQFSLTNLEQAIARENAEIEKNKEILELVETLGELRKTNRDMLVKIVEGIEKRRAL